MDFKKCKKWLKEIQIPNLLPLNVVSIENASYHNVQVNPSPPPKFRKSLFISSLKEKGILYAE
jgi:hypothetical protein